MFRLFVLLSLLSLNALMAWDPCCDSSDCARTYIGVFGGGIESRSTHMSQMGTAFFTEASGGPLAVFAQGRTKKSSSGLAGFQIGYEGSKWGCSDWALTPGGEVEAYFFSHKNKGHFVNPTDRLPEHDFVNSFHTETSVVLVNALFSLNNSCLCVFSPYVGLGIGAAHLDLSKAKSIQVDPVELGINHFNSRRDDSSWAFAAQAKVGLRYQVFDSFHIFGEYRYLYVDSSNYIFGSTVYPTHAPTSPWNVKINNIHHNVFVFGIQFDL